MYKATFVLEGGATRGVYTAGVLDYFMKKNLKVTDIIGVSAGACNAVDYISDQIGRSKDCLIITEKKNRFYGFDKLVKKGNFLDMDLMFDEFANKVFPFDYDEFLASPTKCEIVVTNCMKGKADYLVAKGKEDIMRMCRASSSVPILAPMVSIDNIPYLDGGIADSVPIKRAMEYGNEKIVVILTRNQGYRKKIPSKATLKMCRHKYYKFPNLIKAIENRYIMYNETMDYINQLERLGKIYVMRPTIPVVSRFERRVEKLMEFYQHGYNDGKNEYKQIIEYLK